MKVTMKFPNKTNHKKIASFVVYMLFNIVIGNLAMKGIIDFQILIILFVLFMAFGVLEWTDGFDKGINVAIKATIEKMIIKKLKGGEKKNADI